MLTVTGLRIKKLFGKADGWDLAFLRIWGRRKAIVPTEKYDAIINSQGKTVSDIHIKDYGRDNHVVLLFTDGSNLRIDFKDTLWEYKGNPQVVTDIDWRLTDETIQDQHRQH